MCNLNISDIIVKIKLLPFYTNVRFQWLTIFIINTRTAATLNQYYYYYYFFNVLKFSGDTTNNIFYRVICVFLCSVIIYSWLGSTDHLMPCLHYFFHYIYIVLSYRIPRDLWLLLNYFFKIVFEKKNQKYLNDFKKL